MRSFEAINYSLRPNKNVERKLIAASLRAIERQFDIPNYRYVGFGSMWFTDFILFHRTLGITDMVTMEKDASRAKRVEFNRPYQCIAVKMKAAAAALDEVIDDKPALTWLDYDGPLAAALTGDLETAVGVMRSGSMLLVSVNADVGQLNGKQDDGDELTPLEYLEEICGMGSLAHQAHRLTRNDFPALVAEILHDRLKAAVAGTKPGHAYEPIWTYRYSDNAAMVTVGGMIANPSDVAKLAACGLAGISHLSPTLPFEIDLPILTDREKRVLDQHLPRAGKINPKILPFELRPSEIDAYQRFYLDYPVFNELAV